jgi:hypothetical protein
MSLLGRNVTQSAVQMHAVVPGDKFQHPLPCVVDVDEARRRITGAVLASAEPGFDVGVIVR